MTVRPCSAPFTAQLTSANRQALLATNGCLVMAAVVIRGKLFRTPGRPKANTMITLITTNAAGCTDTLVKSKYIQIKAPQVLSAIYPMKVVCLCPGNQISLSLQSSRNHQLCVAFWRWYYGYRKNPPPILTHRLVPIRLPWFYNDGRGCTDSVSATGAIRVGTKPVVNFDASPRVSCAYQLIWFRITVPTEKADRWLWSFGDGNTSTLQKSSPIHLDTGYMSVKLVVWSNGCKDSLTRPNLAYIKPGSKVYDQPGELSYKICPPVQR